MDTDSMYFALSHDTLEEAVKPELLKEFESNKKQWLSWDKWSNREPGLFKLESEGTRAIALCSKCYFLEDEQSDKAKDVFQGQGHVKSPERKYMEEIRDGFEWVQGHGHKQRVQDERRGDVHVRAAQAWPERLL